MSFSMESFISKLKDDEIDRCVIVSGLEPSLVDKEDVAIYFQSRKNGGGDIERLELFAHGSTAIVVFEDKKCVEGVVGKEHTIKGLKVDVEKCQNISIEPVQVFSDVLAKINLATIDFADQEQARSSVKQVAKETGLQCLEDNRDGGLVVTGSYEQIVAFHDYFHSPHSKLDKKKVNLTNGFTKKEQTQRTDKSSENVTEGHVASKVPIKKSHDKLDQRKANLSKTPAGEKSKTIAATKEQKTATVSLKDQQTTMKDRDSQHERPSENLQSRGKQATKEQSIQKPETQITKKEEENKNKVKTDFKKPEANADSLTDGSLPEIKIKAREWVVFSKTNEKELQQLMDDYGVLFQLSETACKVAKHPSRKCDEEKLKPLSEKLAQMYNKSVKDMKCERFALDGGKENQQIKLRQLVLDFNKKGHIVLERAPDRQSWEVFGVNKKVDDLLNLLEADVGIKRLKATDSVQGEVKEEEIASDKEEIAEEEKDDADVGDCDPNERLEHNVGDIKLSVYKGDITEEDSDAIVNAANQSLRHGSGVARAIVAKGGYSIQDESTRIVITKGELKTGDAVVTHSGKLNCKMIIHAVGPMWDRRNQEQCILQLKLACVSSFQQAEKYGFSSISFPAISSGIYGIPKNVCAEAMFNAVEDCSKSVQNNKIRDVRFVNNDDKTVNAFHKVFKKRYGDGKITKITRKIPQKRQNAQSSPEIQEREFGKESMSTSSMSTVNGADTLQGQKSRIGRSHSTTASTTNRNASRQVDKDRKINGDNYQHLISPLSSSDAKRKPTDQDIEFKPKTSGKEHTSSPTFSANRPSHWLSGSDPKLYQSSPVFKDKYASTLPSSGMGSLWTQNDAGDVQYFFPESQANDWTFGTSSVREFNLPQHSIRIQDKTPRQSYENGKRSTSNGFIDNSWDKRNRRDTKTDQSNHKSKAKPLSSTFYDNYGHMQVDVTSHSLFNGGYGGARPKQSQKFPGQHQMRKSKGEEDKKQQCPICYGKLNRPKTLPDCKHTFCTSCLDRALETAKWCPLCKSPVHGDTGNPQGATFDPQGTCPDYDMAQDTMIPHEAMFLHGSRRSNPQPEGTMTYRKEIFGLPGYEDCGTILVQYSLRSGIQGPEHPNPGQRYDGTTRVAYLPDNKQGFKVYKLLQKAFDRGLVFKIGRSMTSGYDNQIVWADIPHKTAINGGPSNYGYPDPTYLTEVQQILQAMLVSA